MTTTADYVDHIVDHTETTGARAGARDHPRRRPAPLVAAPRPRGRHRGGAAARRPLAPRLGHGGRTFRRGGRRLGGVGGAVRRRRRPPRRRPRGARRHPCPAVVAPPAATRRCAGHRPRLGGRAQPGRRPRPPARRALRDRSATQRSQRSRPGSTRASSPATRSTCGAVAPTPASSSATAWRTIAADPAVGVTALAVDLVPEYDGDTSYPDAVLDVVATTDQPVVVLSGLASGVDETAADRLRAGGRARPRRASAAGCWRCGTCRRPSTGRRPTSPRWLRRDEVPSRNPVSGQTC